jgi:hypothetical protein
MAKPQQAPFPQEIVIGPNWQVVFDAISPTTGAHVAGVKVSDVNLTATNALTGEQVTLPPNPPPLLTNENA